jgi:hypothetical protein
VGSLRSQLEKPDLKLPSTVEERLVAKARNAFGMKKGSKPDAWPIEKYQAFDAARRDLLQKQQDAKIHGKQLTNEEVDKTFDYWFTPGKVVGSGVNWDDDATRAEAVTNPDYQGKPFATEIPKPLRKQIVDNLVAQDIMPDRVAVEWMYQRYQGQNLPRPKEVRIGVKKHTTQDALNNRLHVGTLQP